MDFEAITAGLLADGFDSAPELLRAAVLRLVQMNASSAQMYPRLAFTEHEVDLVLVELLEEDEIRLNVHGRWYPSSWDCGCA